MQNTATRERPMVVPPKGQLSAHELRAAFAYFPSGIIAVAAMVDGAPVGLAASSFTSVSLQPPLVSVCLAHTSTTWPHLRSASRIGLSILSENHDRMARTLAAKGTDRFSEIDWTSTEEGAVFVHGACLWLDTSVEREIEAGDHDIALLRVRAMWSFPEVEPLVFHLSGFRGLRAGSSGGRG